jgi:diguanylate cyclase (GGDEF)-like protein/PAS domain S-box-containing protein
MNDPLTTVLLVEDDPADARLIQDALAATGGSSPGDNTFHVEWVMRLDDALERLDREGIEMILLDLMLPDGHGLDVFHQVFNAAPNAPILVLSAARDEEIARLAVQRGAYDYFVKGHVAAHWLSRTLSHVIRGNAARDALQNSEARFRAMSDASPLGIFLSDAEGNCVYTNAAYQTISGLSFEQTLGTSWSMAIPPEDRQRVLADWRAAAQHDAPFRTEFRFQRKDGSLVWTRVNSATVHDGMRPRGHVQTVEDITAHKATELGLRAAEEALFEEKERAQVTLNSIGDAVLTTDLQGNVTYLNLAAETMTGWSREDALGLPLADVFRIIDGTTRAVAANPARRAMEEDKTVGLAADCVLLRRDGVESPVEDSAAPIHNRDGRVSGAVIVFHDVSQSRAIVLKMAHLAQHDFLTGLPNRVLLTERLSQAIGLAHRHRKRGALLFLDLDNFKRINDTLGHVIGDQLLQLVADRLIACVRATDTVCRQGGDEFVILLAEIEQPKDATHIAEKLRIALAMPHLIGGHELHVTLSIGISVFPDDGIDVATVLQNADTAMFRAKARGRGNYQFFRADMNSRPVHRLSVDG